MLKKEIQYNESESLDNCFNLAKATEERLQQMSDKVRQENYQKRNVRKEATK